MSRSFEYSTQYVSPAAVVHAALTNPVQWQARIELAPTEAAKLERADQVDGGIRVLITDEIPADVLPAIVAKITGGAVPVSRTEDWTAFVDGQATATSDGLTEGFSVTVKTVFTLVEGPGDGSTLTVKGTVEAKVPFVGGKIESLIADNLGQQLDYDRDFLEDWISKNS